MPLKLKFFLNFLAVFGLFILFRPSAQVKKDYFVSLTALAVTATMAEELIGDLRNHRRDPTPANKRAVNFDIVCVISGLIATLAAAVIVPRMNQQQQADADRPPDFTDHRSEAQKMLDDPKVKEGMKMLEGFRARRSASAPSTSLADEPATQDVK